jgi:arylsulfatase A-like enzyme
VRRGTWWPCWALLVSACSTPRAAPQRLIEADPQRHFARIEVSSQEVVAAWDLADPAELSRWQLHDLKAAAGRLQVTGGDPFLSREIAVPGDFDALRIELTRGADDPVKVFWAAPGQGYAEERSAEARPAPTGGGRSIVALPVPRGIEAPRGAVALRVDPTGQRPGGGLVIHRLEALRLHLDPARLRAAGEAAWRVAAGEDRRSALLVASFQPWRRRLDVRPGATRLSLALTRLDGVPGQGRLRLEARAPGSAAVVSQEFHPPAGSWASEVVDLSVLAGDSVDLSLGWEGVAEGEGALAALANPELESGAVGSRADPRPDLVLFVADTLRRDRISPYGASVRVTPRLDAWHRAQATRFDRAVTAAPWTLPSHVSMLSGLDPLRHGANHATDRAGPDLEMLAERLRLAGYETVAITGGGFLHPDFGFDQGFDRYVHWNDPGQDIPELEAHLAVADAVLAEPRDRPLFLFFHTYEAHGPHRRLEPLCAGGDGESRWVANSTRSREPGPGLVNRARFTWFEGKGREGQLLTEADRAELLAVYDCGVARVDRGFGRLLDALQARDRAGRTVVAFTSDHGESLGEEGRFSHGHLTEDDLDVPLLIATVPRQLAGASFPGQMRTIDLAPTLLDLVGAPPLSAADGVSRAGWWRDGPTPGDVAWSYAANTNEGLSRRSPDGEQVVLRNSPWDPTGGSALLFLLRGEHQPRTARDVSGSPAAEEVRRRYDQLASGLLLDLDAGQTGLRLAIPGLPRLRERLKLLDPPCPGCVRSVRAERAEIELPAGRHLRLLLESHRREPLRLEFVSPLAGQVELAPDELGEGVTLRPVDRAWMRRANGDGPAVRISKRGRPGDGARSRDAEVEAGLRALGYVN